MNRHTAQQMGGTRVSGSGATLNASANPNGLGATAWFRYDVADPGSCNDSFGTRVPAATVGAVFVLCFSLGSLYYDGHFRISIKRSHEVIKAYIRSAEAPLPY